MHEWDGSREAQTNLYIVHTLDGNTRPDDFVIAPGCQLYYSALLNVCCKKLAPEALHMALPDIADRDE